MNGINIEEAKEKVELKKQLFKDILGAMIDDKVAKLSVEEVLFISNAAINSFKEKYL